MHVTIVQNSSDTSSATLSSAFNQAIEYESQQFDPTICTGLINFFSMCSKRQYEIQTQCAIRSNQSSIEFSLESANGPVGTDLTTIDCNSIPTHGVLETYSGLSSTGHGQDALIVISRAIKRSLISLELWLKDDKNGDKLCNSVQDIFLVLMHEIETESTALSDKVYLLRAVSRLVASHTDGYKKLRAINGLSRIASLSKFGSQPLTIEVLQLINFILKLSDTDSVKLQQSDSSPISTTQLKSGHSVDSKSSENLSPLSPVVADFSPGSLVGGIFHPHSTSPRPPRQKSAQETNNSYMNLAMSVVSELLRLTPIPTSWLPRSRNDGDDEGDDDDIEPDPFLTRYIVSSSSLIIERSRLDSIESDYVNFASGIDFDRLDIFASSLALGGSVAHQISANGLKSRCADQSRESRNFNDASNDTSSDTSVGRVLSELSNKDSGTHESSKDSHVNKKTDENNPVLDIETGRTYLSRPPLANEDYSAPPEKLQCVSIGASDSGAVSTPSESTDSRGGALHLDLRKMFSVSDEALLVLLESCQCISTCREAVVFLRNISVVARSGGVCTQVISIDLLSHLPSNLLVH